MTQFSEITKKIKKIAVEVTDNNDGKRNCENVWFGLEYIGRVTEKCDDEINGNKWEGNAGGGRVIAMEVGFYDMKIKLEKSAELGIDRRFGGGHGMVGQVLKG
jgi:hypothetical protein